MKKKSKKLSLPEATDLLKKIVLKAHQNAQHKNIGSRFKSIFGLQKTSIGMFLDSLLDEYKKNVPAKDFNKEVEEIFDVMHDNQDIWDKYQKRGDYPHTFTYAGILMLDSFTGEKSDKKIKEEAENAMLLEIRNSGLD